MFEEVQLGLRNILFCVHSENVLHEKLMSDLKGPRVIVDDLVQMIYTPLNYL